MQYFNQILTVVLEVLDDSDSSIRELALSLIIEMLKNQVTTPFCAVSMLDYDLALISTCNCTYFSPRVGILGYNKRLFYLSVYCFQKDAMENSVEIVIEKLLNVTKDIVPKVTNIILF